VAANITAKDFAGLVKSPERLDDPFARYLAYLKQSNGLVDNVYELDKSGGFTGKGSPAAFDFTIHRLAAGSQMLLDLWCTACWRAPSPCRNMRLHSRPEVVQGRFSVSFGILSSLCRF